MKLRHCVETEIRRHVDDARVYAGSGISCLPSMPTFGMQWVLASQTANAVKVRPLGLVEGVT